MGFSRQEYWSGLPLPILGNLLDPGIKPVSLVSPALAGGFFTTSATWEAQLQGRQEAGGWGARRTGLEAPEVTALVGDGKPLQGFEEVCVTPLWTGSTTAAHGEQAGVKDGCRVTSSGALSSCQEAMGAKLAWSVWPV